MVNTSRVLEDLGFLAGVVFAGCYVLGVRVGPAAVESWVVVAITGTLVAPKMLGRATAGRIWDSVSSLIPGRKSSANVPPGGA